MRRWFSYYVASPDDRAVIHRTNNFGIGQRAICGRRQRPLWFYWVQARNVPRNRSICAGCGKSRS